ncbi:MAG: sugar phosphate nucleotidyltransferase [Gemmatimonadales bacterium]
MKVVLFCGGLGLRLREAGENVPKPMVPIGYRPIMWHLMKYYAHFGHKEFIVCLGYRGDAIKQYFLNYDECVSNDFVLSKGGRKLELVNSDISDWTITFADTGVNTTIGGRLKAAEKYLGDDEWFMANYCDGLSDLHLPTLLEYFRDRNKVASFVCVKPNLSYHAVSVRPDGRVAEIKAITETNLRINGGYFFFKRDIFRYIEDGEDLVQEPFQRLIGEDQLLAYPYDGFLASMDTFKDKQRLDDMYARGNPPWQVWNHPEDANGNGSQGTSPDRATIARPPLSVTSRL